MIAGILLTMLLLLVSLSRAINVTIPLTINPRVPTLTFLLPYQYMVMATLHKNSQVAQSVLREVIKKVGREQPVSNAHNSLQHAILTPPERITEDTKRRLGYIIGKYLPKQ